jgi:hypothetical protein
MPPLIFVVAGVGIAVAVAAAYGRIMGAMTSDRASAEPAADPVPLIYDSASDTYAPKRDS